MSSNNSNTNVQEIDEKEFENVITENTSLSAKNDNLLQNNLSSNGSNKSETSVSNEQKDENRLSTFESENQLKVPDLKSINNQDTDVESTESGITAGRSKLSNNSHESYMSTIYSKSKSSILNSKVVKSTKRNRPDEEIFDKKVATIKEYGSKIVMPKKIFTRKNTVSPLRNYKHENNADTKLSVNSMKTENVKKSGS